MTLALSCFGIMELVCALNMGTLFCERNALVRSAYLCCFNVKDARPTSGHLFWASHASSKYIYYCYTVNIYFVPQGGIRRVLGLCPQGPNSVITCHDRSETWWECVHRPCRQDSFWLIMTLWSPIRDLFQKVSPGWGITQVRALCPPGDTK